MSMKDMRSVTDGDATFVMKKRKKSARAPKTHATSPINLYQIDILAKGNRSCPFCIGVWISVWEVDRNISSYGTSSYGIVTV